MTAIVQRELQQVFRFTNDLRAARAAGDEARVAEMRDEIDTIRLMTDSEALRKRCAVVLAEGNDRTAAESRA